MFELLKATFEPICVLIPPIVLGILIARQYDSEPLAWTIFIITLLSPLGMMATTWTWPWLAVYYILVPVKLATLRHFQQRWFETHKPIANANGPFPPAYNAHPPRTDSIATLTYLARSNLYRILTINALLYLIYRRH